MPAIDSESSSYDQLLPRVRQRLPGIVAVYAMPSRSRTVTITPAVVGSTFDVGNDVVTRRASSFGSTVPRATAILVFCRRGAWPTPVVAIVDPLGSTRRTSRTSTWSRGRLTAGGT